MALRGKRKVCLEELQALLEETKASYEETKASHEETKAELRAMEERLEGAEKDIWHLQGRLDKYEGRCARKRHDVEIEASTSRYLQLKFNSQPSPRIFTLTKVRGENSDDVGLSVVDPMTGQVISSGPESSMDVELVLVNSELKAAGSGKWKLEYLEDNIVRPRRDNKLLMGDTILKLKGGGAVVSNLKITDTSSWVPGGHFRLVARVANGYFHGMRVKEAITDRFMVRVRRLKGCQKHHPPHPKDEVWRLEGISKKGRYHQRLMEKGIYTVEDFWKSLQENRNALKDEILKMTPDGWEKTVNHAEKCTPCGLIDQPSNPHILEATEVVKQWSIQAVDAPNIHINNLPFGSSNPPIESEGCWNGQHIRGPSFLEGLYTALQQSADGTSPLREPSPLIESWNDFGSYGTLSPSLIGQAPDMDSFLSKLKENDYYGLTDDIHFFSDFPLQQQFPVAEHVDSANGCSYMPTDSTAEKHQAYLKWSKLIVAMAFSVRICRVVAVSDKNIETP